jgi:hypothetical protein
LSKEKTVVLNTEKKKNKKRAISVKNVVRPVTFIDKKGRIWTVELDLPENTTMEIMLQIAKANISLMNNDSAVLISDLCVLVEPEDKNETVLGDVDRIVVFHKNKLNQIESR